MFYDNRNIIKRGTDVEEFKSKKYTSKGFISDIWFFSKSTDRDTVAQAYEHIVQFLHRYKNNIEFVTKEELVAVTLSIKETIVTRVLDKLKKAGVLSVRLEENNKIFPYTYYYINKNTSKKPLNTILFNGFFLMLLSKT